MNRHIEYRVATIIPHEKSCDDTFVINEKGVFLVKVSSPPSYTLFCNQSLISLNARNNTIITKIHVEDKKDILSKIEPLAQYYPGYIVMYDDIDNMLVLYNNFDPCFINGENIETVEKAIIKWLEYDIYFQEDFSNITLWDYTPFNMKVSMYILNEVVSSLSAEQIQTVNENLKKHNLGPMYKSIKCEYKGPQCLPFSLEVTDCRFEQPKNSRFRKCRGDRVNSAGGYDFAYCVVDKDSSFSEMKYCNGEKIEELFTIYPSKTIERMIINNKRHIIVVYDRLTREIFIERMKIHFGKWPGTLSKLKFVATPDNRGSVSHYVLLRYWDSIDETAREAILKDLVVELFSKQMIDDINPKIIYTKKCIMTIPFFAISNRINMILEHYGLTFENLIEILSNGQNSESKYNGLIKVLFCNWSSGLDLTYDNVVKINKTHISFDDKVMSEMDEQSVSFVRKLVDSF